MHPGLTEFDMIGFLKEGVDHRSHVFHAGRRVFTRNQPAVDLDLAPVGDDIDALPSLDAADR